MCDREASQPGALDGPDGRGSGMALASSRLPMQTAAFPSPSNKNDLFGFLPSFVPTATLTTGLAARYSLPSSRCATEAFLPGERRAGGGLELETGGRRPVLAGGCCAARTAQHGAGAARAGTKRAVGPGAHGACILQLGFGGARRG